MGVFVPGENSYDVPADLFFSFPVKCRDGNWALIQGLPLAEQTRKRLPATIDELVQERNLALSLMKGSSHL